jgi:hypothetical protein
MPSQYMSYGLLVNLTVYSLLLIYLKIVNYNTLANYVSGGRSITLAAVYFVSGGVLRYR